MCIRIDNALAIVNKYICVASVGFCMLVLQI